MGNFKVRCVKSNCKWWTEGKVYDVKNGCITDDDGDSTNSNFSNISDVNKYCSDDSENYTAKFELVTEEYVKGTMPKLEQIQEFDLVKIRESGKCIIINGYYGIIPVSSDNVSDGSEGVAELKNYTPDLKHKDFKEFDIIAYKHSQSHRFLLGEFLKTEEPEWDWVRSEKEEESKEVEKDEVMEAVKTIMQYFGFNFKEN